MRALFALFIRSLREDLRARLPPILRAALVLIILLIIGANQRKFGWIGAPGCQFLGVVMMLNLAFIGVAALSIFPSAIAEEKEDGTLTLLRMTNLNPLSILLGKGATRLISALMLLAAQIPFTMLAVTLGGVTMTQILHAYAILGATTFFLCNLAMLASVYCRTATRAGFLTGIIGGVLYAVLPFICTITSFGRWRPGRATTGELWETISNYILEANPVWAMGNLLFDYRRSSFLSNQVWFSLGAGTLCFLFAWLIFDRYCATAETAPGRVKKTKNGKPRRWAHVSRPWQRLPLAWKDFNFMAGGRFGFYLRLFMAGLILLGAYGVAWSSYQRELEWVARHDNISGHYYSSKGSIDAHFWKLFSLITIVLAGYIAALELLLITGRIFGAERRNLTLSSLVALPWSVGKIVRQKILGCLAVLLPWVILAAVGISLNFHNIWEEIIREFTKLAVYHRQGGGIRILSAISVICYVCTQALLSLTVLVWFSLRIRRGALPATIATMTVVNVIFGITVDVFGRNRSDETTILFIGFTLSLIALIAMCRKTHRRIQLAAAED